MVANRICVKLLLAVLPCMLLGATDVLGADESVPKIIPPEIRTGKQEIALPETVDDVSVGGGGRYLALHFTGLKKIGIFDLNRLKLAGYISANDGATKFAAGATKLLVISSDSGVVARWDLATQKRELTQSIDLGGPPGNVLLGSASAGPAIVTVSSGSRIRGTAHVVDMTTLKTTPFTAANNQRSFGSGSTSRISADGNVIASTGSSPSGVQTFIKSGEGWTGYSQRESAGYAVPTFDGRFIHTSRGVLTNQGRRVGGDSTKEASIPALHGPFCLSLSLRSATKRANGQPVEVGAEKVFLKLEGDNRPLAEVIGLAPIFPEEDRESRRKIPVDKRLFLIPDAGLILQLDPANKKLIAMRFDIEKALRESSIDFLLITSRAPQVVKAGSRLSYQLEVKSKAGGVKYSLDTGPTGMRVSPTGLVTWATSTRSPATNNVIISVSDKSEQQVFHTFVLTVTGGVADAVPAVADTAPAKASTPGDAKAITTIPAEGNANSQEIKLPGTLTNVVVGGAGRFLLLHLRDLKKVAVLDVSKAKVVGYLPASDDNTSVVAGATKALVFGLSQGVVTRYRLDTLERELSVAIPFSNPIQFMGMGSGSEGPVLLRSSQGTEQLDSCTFHFLDINTLKAIPVSWGTGHPPHSSYRDLNEILVSTNGQAFVIRDMGGWRLDGTNLKKLGDYSSRGGGYPTADGRHFLVDGRLYNADMRQIGDQSSNFGVAVPSVTGSYFLSFNQRESYPRRSDSGSKGAKLYMIGDNRPLVTIPDLALPELASGDYANRMGWNKRVFFIPDAQVILTIPSSNDRLLLRRFKIDEALDASGVDYLVVASQAPSQAELGKPYTYAMKVKSKRGGVKYSLDASPAGMAVSTEGKISWDVPKDLKDDKANVIVSIRDASGQETFHTFAIEIPELKQKTAATQPSPTNGIRPPGIAVLQPVPRLGEIEPVANANVAPTFRPAIRTWTDKSGERKLTGKFVEVTDKKVLVLELENGQKRNIPLTALCNEDIYEAVRSDLLGSGKK